MLEAGLVVAYDKRLEARDERMAWIDYGFSVLERSVVEDIPAETAVDLADGLPHSELARASSVGTRYRSGSTKRDRLEESPTSSATSQDADGMLAYAGRR